MDEVGPWDQYRRLVLAELESMRGGIKELSRKIDDIRTEEIHNIWLELNKLQMKAGVWGAVAGLIPVLLAIALMWLNKKVGP